MKNLINGTFVAAIATIQFAGAAASAEPNHIADYIRYEVKVIKIVPDTPVKMEHIARAQEEYVELLIESKNEKLQLAYIKQSIVGTLEMVPFHGGKVTLAGFKNDIEEYAGDGAKERSFEDYARFRAQLAVVYAGIFKREYAMSFSPKVERLLNKMQKKDQGESRQLLIPASAANDAEQMHEREPPIRSESSGASLAAAR